MFNRNDSLNRQKVLIGFSRETIAYPIKWQGMAKKTCKNPLMKALDGESKWHYGE